MKHELTIEERVELEQLRKRWEVTKPELVKEIDQASVDIQRAVLNVDRYARQYLEAQNEIMWKLAEKEIDEEEAVEMIEKLNQIHNETVSVVNRARKKIN